MATLEQIREKLRAKEQRGGNNSNAERDNTVYPLWNIKEGSDSVIRFLPDSDVNNDFFWVERLLIYIPFSGVAGQADSKPVTVRVPCMEMYGEVDPILAEIRPWWDDAELKTTASLYWKKRSYFFQGFVVEDGVKEEFVLDNPIRRFIITPQIYQLIKASLLDTELDSMPTDYVSGIDFRVSKTTKGQYSDYSTSKWSRRSRPLSESELEAVNKYGLFNLKDFLPKKPTEAEQKAIKEMFEASVNGEPYDLERWGQFYRPYGLSGPDRTESSSASAPVVESKPATARPAAVRPAPAPVVEDNFDDDVASAEVVAIEQAKPAAATGGNKAEDILKMIRSRNTG